MVKTPIQKVGTLQPFHKFDSNFLAITPLLAVKISGFFSGSIDAFDVMQIMTSSSTTGPWNMYNCYTLGTTMTPIHGQVDNNPPQIQVINGRALWLRLAK